MSFLATQAASSKVTALGLCDSLATADLEKFEAKLKGTAVSSMGFLGTDTLREVSVYDASELAKINITYKQIADKLTSLVCRLIRLHNLDEDQSTHVTHKRFSMENKFILVMDSYYRGLQSCPFEEHETQACDTSFSCYNFVLTNIRQNRSIRFGGLLPHLIGEHEFAEGRGAPYRLDPKDAAQVLELEPGVDYTPATTIEKKWKLMDLTDLSPSIFHSAREAKRIFATKIIESSDKKAVCMFIPDLFDVSSFEMHIFSEPSAVCDFDTNFNDTKLSPSYSFYLDSRYSRYSARHLVFSQQKANATVLDEHDKILPKEVMPIRLASMPGARIIGIRSADGTIIPIRGLVPLDSIPSVSARSGGASSLAATVGGGGGSAAADSATKPAGEE